MAAASLPFSVTLRVSRPASTARVPFRGLAPCVAALLRSRSPFLLGRRVRLRALGRMRPLPCRRSCTHPFAPVFLPYRSLAGVRLARSLLRCRVVALLNTFAGVAGVFTSPLRLLYRLAYALPPHPSPRVPIAGGCRLARAQVVRLFSPFRATGASHPLGLRRGCRGCRECRGCRGCGFLALVGSAAVRAGRASNNSAHPERAPHDSAGKSPQSSPPRQTAHNPPVAKGCAPNRKALRSEELPVCVRYLCGQIIGLVLALGCSLWQPFTSAGGVLRWAALRALYYGEPFRDRALSIRLPG